MRLVRFVMVLAFAGSGLVLPVLPAHAAQEPPVNGRLAVISFDDCGDCNRPLVTTLDPDGSDARDLLVAYDTAPSVTWSPDGETVAYKALDGVAVSDSDVNNSHLVVADAADTVTVAPTWSPDGSRLAFISAPSDAIHPGNTPGVLRHVGLDGSSPTIVTDDAMEPAWGPDGRIAFVRDGVVHTIAPDGSGLASVATGREPHWNSDGTRLAFSASEGIVSTAPDGTARQVLVPGATPRTSFDWSPDGTQVAHIDIDDSVSLVHVRTIATGATRVLAQPTAAFFVDWGTAPVVKHPCGGRDDATIVGTEGPDRITGTLGDDVIVGLGGNDVIGGLRGNDVICGGPGDDSLQPGSGADVVIGDAGVDGVSYAERTTVPVVVTLGNAAADDGSATDGPVGARDFVDPSVEGVTGGQADDRLFGNSFANRLDGNGGNDYLFGGPGADDLRGGEDDDRLVGGPHADRLDGYSGTDTATYSERTESLTITIGNGKPDDGSNIDLLSGVRDHVFANVENVFGGAGNDNIVGNALANLLRGGAGNDILTGGLGADFLLGEAGIDLLRAYDQRKDTRIDCGTGTDKAASYDKRLDPAPVSCP